MRKAKMAKQLMPRAELETRPGDVPLPDDVIAQLSLFKELKRKPSLDKYPGAHVIRFFRKDEVIFRQGEAGWTAFYILTSEDILAIREHQLKAATRDGERQRLEREVIDQTSKVIKLKGTTADDPSRTVA